MNTSLRSVMIALLAIGLLSTCIHRAEKSMSRNLVFIGDSLTQWFDWQRRFPDDAVMNLGISGETVEGLLSRREAIREKVHNPDIIFLMSGINDLLTSRYDIADAYSEVVRSLTTSYKGTTIVVQSILPSEFPGLDEGIIRETNRQLAQIAKKHHAEYLDVYPHFFDAKGKVIGSYLNDDGVHLTSKGYEAWSREVERFLRAHR